MCRVHTLITGTACFFLLLFASAFAEEFTLYVDPGGDRNADGTKEAPFGHLEPAGPSGGETGEKGAGPRSRAWRRLSLDHADGIGSGLFWNGRTPDHVRGVSWGETGFQRWV